MASKNVADVKPLLGDCDEVLNNLLNEHEREGVHFGPALAFLDQFGYGDVSMDLVARILKFEQCEVFSYLSYDAMNRWITDPHKAATYTRAYGGEEWRECIQLPPAQRQQRMLELYKDALKAKGGAKYVASFLMLDRNNEPLYWLLFCTNHLSGLFEMKRAMWAVDKSGGFRFSDADNPNQKRLFLNDGYDDDWLASELQQKLGGSTLKIETVREFVLVETPCYLFKGALARLESDRRIAVRAPVGRKAGKFPDDLWDAIEIRFQKSLL